MAKLHRLKVLVVDDHHNMRHLWRGILHGFGIRHMVEAGSGQEAIELLRYTNSIDVMIVDHHLGEGLTGAELCQMLRRGVDSPAPHLPMIACTGDTRRPTIRALVNSGVDEILAKPVSAQQAWEKLYMVVNRRRHFIRAKKFCGPDRRRMQSPYFGAKERREVVDDTCLVD